MPVNLQGRSFLKLLDFTTEEIEYLLDLSKEFKKLKLTRTPHKYLDGKNIALLFEKTSTRTRCSFEVAGYDLGMGVTYLEPGSSQMGHKESIEDTAKVLGRYYDGIEYRGFSQDLVQELSDNAGVPVWNGLTDEFHPTQMLADILTIEENFNSIKGLNLTFMGDARNNVANSLMVISAKLGINFTACGPKELIPSEELVSICKEIALTNNSNIVLTDDPIIGATNADIIYTDIWVSMGEPSEVWSSRIHLLEKFRVTKELMDLGSDNCIFLHCLPSFHDINTVVGKNINKEFGINEMEVTDEVFRSKYSKVFDQAENRMHTIKAVMYATLK